MSAPNDLQLTIQAGTLPTGAIYNPQTYFNAIVARMSATISGGNILWGQIGGTQPQGQLPNNGLWFGDPNGGHGYWNDWNADAAIYLPIPLVCGQYVNSVLRTSNIICGAVTANQTITTPDQSGTMALAEFLPEQLGTQTFNGAGAVNINWTVNKAAYIVIASGTVGPTISNSTAKDGQSMDIFVCNQTGAALTITWGNWPVEWPSGVTGNTSVAANSINYYRLKFQAHILFGEVVGTGYAFGSSPEIPAPQTFTASSGSPLIDVQFNLNLQAGNPALTDFIVMVNGSAVTPLAATTNGLDLTIQMPNNIKTGDTITVAYNGSDIKGVNGNAVAHWAAHAVSVSGGGGGIHNSPNTGPTGSPLNPP